MSSWPEWIDPLPERVDPGPDGPDVAHRHGHTVAGALIAAVASVGLAGAAVFLAGRRTAGR